MTRNNSIFSKSPHIIIYFLSLFIAILNACALSPIYVQIETNIAFEYTVLPLVLNYLILIFDTLYISFLVAALAFSVYEIHSGKSNKKATIIYVISIVFLKHVLNLVVSSVIDGFIDYSFDIPMTLYSILTDLLILSVIALISNHICKKHFAHVKAMLKASKYLDAVDYDEMEDVFPFKGFFKIKKNPVLIPAFTAAIITSLIFIVQRLFADFVVLGAPSTLFELLDILLSYIGDILFGLLAYTSSYFALYYIFLNKQNNI